MSCSKGTHGAPQVAGDTDGQEARERERERERARASERGRGSDTNVLVVPEEERTLSHLIYTERDSIYIYIYERQQCAWCSRERVQEREKEREREEERTQPPTRAARVYASGLKLPTHEALRY